MEGTNHKRASTKKAKTLRLVSGPVPLGLKKGDYYHVYPSLIYQIVSLCYYSAKTKKRTAFWQNVVWYKNNWYKANSKGDILESYETVKAKPTHFVLFVPAIKDTYRKPFKDIIRSKKFNSRVEKVSVEYALEQIERQKKIPFFTVKSNKEDSFFV